MRDGKGTNNRGESNVLKGLVAGLIGGLVASWTMNRFQDVWSKVSYSLERSPGDRVGNASPEYAAGDGEESANQDLEFGSQPEIQDDTTVRTASAISEGVFDHKLTPGEKKIAGTAVHYL